MVLASLIALIIAAVCVIAALDLYNRKYPLTDEEREQLKLDLREW